MDVKRLASSLLGSIVVVLTGMVLLTVLPERPNAEEPLASTEPTQLANPDVEVATTSINGAPVVPTGMQLYVEVVGGCDWQYVGTCANLRSGPGVDYPVVMRLRKGIVLKVLGIVSSEGRTWYKLDPGDDLRYPDRVKSRWYVAEDLVRLFSDTGEQTLDADQRNAPEKRIVVDLGKETLSAYDGDTLAMRFPVSTGLNATPTPVGTFAVFKKMPSRYMQGPIPEVSAQYYDLPGVPWDMYFTSGGAAIHGAYWHDRFGQEWSHGCVNLSLENAKDLYDWAPIGTLVIVKR